MDYVLHVLFICFGFYQWSQPLVFRFFMLALWVVWRNDVNLENGEDST